MFEPLVMLVVVYPILVFVISLIAQLIIKKKAIILYICFAGWFVISWTIFKSGFLIVFPYTIISLIGTLIGDLIIKAK